MNFVPILTLSAVVLVAAGCVERTMKIQTDPPGALVIVNDEEVGPSPAKFTFLWYGDYEIILRKPGYQTVHTHHRLTPPWYQLPGIDLVAETMIPGTLRDVHELPVFTLEPAEDVTVESVTQRAVELRAQAIGGS